MGQIGLGLRALSLWGRLGNGLALALYAAVCLLPVGYMLYSRGRRGGRRGDWLLPLLSLLLCYVLYLMANPAKLAGRFAIASMDSGMAAAKAILGGAVYCVIICYGLLRLLEVFRASGEAELRRYLIPMLYVLAALFVLSIFGGCLGGLLASIKAFRAGNTGGHGFTEVFIALQYAVEALPYALSIRTALLGAELIERLDGEGAVEAAERLSGWCVNALVYTVSANTAWYIVQILFSSELRSITGNINLPLLSVSLTVAALLFARIVVENRRLREDSEMII